MLRHAEICETEFPLHDLPAEGGFALAAITGVTGASYRPLGAMMLIEAGGRHRGSLSSGCLEQDVILRARQAMSNRQPMLLRYGEGSPFLDITLPCGGALEITIIPHPPRGLLAAAAERLAARQGARIVIAEDHRLVAQAARGLALWILPQIRFLVLGKGPEAACFASLARQAGYPVELHAPDRQTLDEAGFGEMTPGWPEGVRIDPRTAIAMFFHDHDREAELLGPALAGPAFYIGAQGSLRAHQARCKALAALGVPAQQIARLASPFGLIPSARDPRTLAVSVLAHVLDRARQQSGAA